MDKSAQVLQHPRSNHQRPSMEAQFRKNWNTLPRGLYWQIGAVCVFALAIGLFGGAVWQRPELVAPETSIVKAILAMLLAGMFLCTVSLVLEQVSSSAFQKNLSAVLLGFSALLIILAFLYMLYRSQQGF